MIKVRTYSIHIQIWLTPNAKSRTKSTRYLLLLLLNLWWSYLLLLLWELLLLVKRLLLIGTCQVYYWLRTILVYRKAIHWCLINKLMRLWHLNLWSLFSRESWIVNVHVVLDWLERLVLKWGESLRVNLLNFF